MNDRIDWIGAAQFVEQAFWWCGGRCANDVFRFVFRRTVKKQSFPLNRWFSIKERSRVYKASQFEKRHF